MARVEIKGLAALRAKMEKMREEYPDILDIAMDDTADAISLRAQQIVPVDMGFLRSSITVRRRPLHKTIGSRAPYASDIEYGTPTGTGPHGGPRPYFRPAFMSEVPRLPEFFRRAVASL